MKALTKNLLSSLAILSVSLTAFASGDSDTFFLLDVEKECISSEFLISQEAKKQYQLPSEILAKDEFVVFEEDVGVASEIKNITDLKQKANQLFSQANAPGPQEFYHGFMKHMTPAALTAVLESLLENDQLLDEITSNSYHHVTGFTKIVLDSGPKENEYKVRLHLWWPDADKDTTKLVVEDKHVHKWNFSSRMYSGSFEDQLYVLDDVRPAEKLVYNQFIEKLNALPNAEQKKVLDSINIIEISMYGQTRFQRDKFRCNIDKEHVYTKQQIMDKFELTEKDFIDVISVHESYITMPNVSGEYGLKKIGLKSLSFPVIYTINKGQTYYHHYTLAHRLISDPTDMVATLIVTAPPIKEAEPYLLMRGEEGEDITKVAPKLTKDKLVLQIKQFIAHLAKQGETVH